MEGFLRDWMAQYHLEYGNEWNHPGHAEVYIETQRNKQYDIRLQETEKMKCWLHE